MSAPSEQERQRLWTTTEGKTEDPFLEPHPVSDEEAARLEASYTAEADNLPGGNVPGDANVSPQPAVQRQPEAPQRVTPAEEYRQRGASRIAYLLRNFHILKQPSDEQANRKSLELKDRVTALGSAVRRYTQPDTKKGEAKSTQEEVQEALKSAGLAARSVLPGPQSPRTEGAANRTESHVAREVREARAARETKANYKLMAEYGAPVSRDGEILQEIERTLRDADITKSGRLGELFGQARDKKAMALATAELLGYVISKEIVERDLKLNENLEHRNHVNNLINLSPDIDVRSALRICFLPPLKSPSQAPQPSQPQLNRASTPPPHQPSTKSPEDDES